MISFILATAIDSYMPTSEPKLECFIFLFPLCFIFLFPLCFIFLFPLFMDGEYYQQLIYSTALILHSKTANINFKTYQFINTVIGVRRSHETATLIFF